VNVSNRISNMSKEEKVKELRTYLVSSNLLRLDIDKIMADQAIVGAPDSALDVALLHCATIAGSVLGRPPMTADELCEALKGQGPAVCDWLRRHSTTPYEMPGVGMSAPRFSLRRSR
jgi:hypothetical protein